MRRTLDLMRAHINQLDSLNGARNPAASMRQCECLCNDLRVLTNDLEQLVFLFDRQLARKAAAKK